MKYKMMIAALATVLIATSVQAQQTPYGYSGAYGARPQHGMGMPRAARPAVAGPAAKLKEGMDKLVTFLQQSNRPSTAQLAVFLQQEIAPYFDFEYMAKMAAGLAYERMDEQQRLMWTQKLTKIFLAALTQRLGVYDNQTVHYMAQRTGDGGRMGTASVLVQGGKGYPSRLTFRFYKSGGDWKVYDVAANGQSAVAHYRREFRRSMYTPQAGYGRPVMPTYRR